MVVRSPAQTMVNKEWKVLVIDDDEDDFIIVRDMLKGAKGRKFDIHWANTYMAGREKLISNHYHAVLVDYDLGVHSGIELIQEANERGYAAPLILFTGRGSYEVDVEAMGAGATLYLTKGEANPLLLERAIRYAIEIKQRENELREAREAAERELAERKRAEAILRISEAQLRKSETTLRRIDARWNAAIESINIGVIIATEDEQVIYWNPAARQMHGFTRPDEGIEPLENTPITFQLWTPDGSHLLALEEWPMRRIKRGEQVRDLELRIRRPDQGWEKFFSYSGVMVDTTGGERLIFLTCQDLTVKHQVEDSLRESEARQRLALTAADMVAWEYDPATLKVTLSENAEQVLDLPRRHENSDQGYNLIHPDDVERHRALVTQAIAIGGSYVSVYRHPHTEKDIWLEEHGQAIVDPMGRTVRLVGVVQNITDRKEAEAALRQSEEKYAKSFRSSPAAIAISTIAEGRFTEVNERFTEIFGYSREEMIGHTSVELGLYPNFSERNEILRLLYQEGRFRDYEIRMLNRNGEPIDLLFSGERIEIDGHDYLLALILNITDRKRTEAALQANAEALKESQARLIEFVENIHANYFALDREWRITYLNRPFSEVLGLHPSDLLGKNFWEAFPQYLGTDIEPHYRKVMSERVTVHFRRGGIYSKSLYDISLYPTQEGLASFSIDRTEELRYQQKLEDESARLDTILQALPVGIWIADANGRIIGKNDQADRIWAGSASINSGVDEFREFQFWDVQSGKKLAPESFPLPQVVKTGQPVVSEEHRIRRFDGSEGYILVSAVPVKDREGRLTGAVSINLDITERKKAEQKLRLSEERFYRAFDANPNAQVISRLSDGQIESINEGFELLFGYYRDEVIGKTSRELRMFANDADRDEAVRRIRAENHLRDFELAIRTKSGEIRQASLSVEMIPMDGETLMLTVIQDITERKSVEEALRLSEERYRVAVINAPGEYSQTDRELRYQWVYNPHPGFQPEDVIGKRDDELEDSEDVRRLVARKLQVLVSGVGLREELVFHRSDGIHIYDMTIEPLRDPNGQIVGVTTAAFEITELKRAEQALQESEENFRQLADAMPQLVWTARADGTVDYYNQRYKEYDGIAPVESDHWEWGPVLHPDDLQPTVDTWNHAIEAGEMYQIEHRVRMIDGTFCWHLSRGLPVKDQKGNVVRWYGTATNIHAQKEIEEKLRQSNQELEQFAFVASHDLQEPLRKIILFGDSLRSHVCDTTDSQASDYLDRMQNAAERMQIMIKGLLELSRVKNRGGNFELVDLNQVSKDVVSDLQSQILAVKGQVKIDPLPTIQGDALQMHQLFQNLIGNALKFHKPDVSPDVYVSGKIVKTQNDNMAEIQFTDNGIGFEQQYAEQIFQPFQRLHGRSKYEGTGLGLAICQKIVERHQGTIEVQSTPGQGSIFTIRLPLNPIQ